VRGKSTKGTLVTVGVAAVPRIDQGSDISDSQDAIDKIAERLPEGGNEVKRYSTNEGGMDDAKVKRPDSSHEISASRVRDILQSKSFNETEVGALFELLMEKGMLDKLVSKFGYQKAKGHENEVKETQLRPTAQSDKYVKKQRKSLSRVELRKPNVGSAANRLDVLASSGKPAPSLDYYPLAWSSENT
jgi:hypothetical protein